MPRPRPTSTSTASSHDLPPLEVRHGDRRAARPVPARAPRRARGRRDAGSSSTTRPSATRRRSCTATTSTRSRRAPSSSPTCATTTRRRSTTPSPTCATSTARSRKRLPELRARDRESVATWSGSRTTGSSATCRPPRSSAATGSVDWLCFPRFDSSSCFARAARDARQRPLADRARRRRACDRALLPREHARARERVEDVDRPRAGDRLHAAAREGARHRAHRRGAGGSRRDAHGADRSASTTAR